MPIVGDKVKVDLENEFKQLFLLENQTHLVIIHIIHDNPSIIPSQVISLFNLITDYTLQINVEGLHYHNVVFL
jgi:hypothetical protein